MGSAVDLSSALAVLHLAGPMARELVARSCRVDLHESAMPSGRAVATVMAQVAVTIAAIPSGMLLLTPATTARHFREWLLASAKLCALPASAARATIEMFGSSSP
jgi:sarcosine oxidase subunit gamma